MKITRAFFIFVLVVSLISPQLVTASTHTVSTQSDYVKTFSSVTDSLSSNPQKAELQKAVNDLYDFVNKYGSNIALAKLKLLENKYGVKATSQSSSYYYRYPSGSRITPRNLGQDYNFGGNDMSREMDFLIGVDAAEEAIQLININDRRPDLDGEKIHNISSVAAVEIESHPWNQMMVGLDKPDKPEIFSFVPEDHFMVYFKDIDHSLSLENSLKEISSFGDYFLNISNALDIKEKIVNRLGIEDFESLSGGVGEVIFVSEDISFIEGTNYALIFKIESDALKTFSRFLDDEKSSSELIGDYLVVSTGEGLLANIKSANLGSINSMTDAKDLEYAMAVLDERRDGLAFFSDELIRKMTGPEYRINYSRRNLVLNEAESLQYIVFAYRSISGEWPRSFGQIASEGYIDIKKAAQSDLEYSISTNGIVSHQEWGSIYEPKAVSEVEIDKITDRELTRYDNFKRDYQSYWTEFIDPIGISFAIGDQLYFHTIILPLIDESSYNLAKALTGGSPSEFTILRDPVREPPIWFLSKLDFDNWIEEVLYEEFSYSSGYPDQQERSLTFMLRDARFQAEIYYTKNNNFGSRVSGSCDTIGSMFSDLAMKDMIDSAKEIAGDSNIRCYANSDSYAISAKIPEFEAYYCIDSTGVNQYQERHTSSTNCSTNPITNSEMREMRRDFEDVSTSVEKRNLINKEINDELRLEGSDQIDIFGIVGEELELGIGSSIGFEFDNISNFDIYLGIELLNQERAQDFINSVYKVFADEFGNSGFGFFSLPKEHPPANNYNGIDYYVIPTGFVNLYYMFYDSHLYFSISQLSINNIIDSIKGDSGESRSEYNKRTEDYLGREGNIAMFADLGPYDQYISDLVDSSAQSSYTNRSAAKNILGYIGDYQILGDSLGSLSESSSYFPGIPEKFFGLDIEVADDDVYLLGSDRLSFSEIDFGRSYSYYYGESEGGGTDFSDLFSDEIKSQIVNDFKKLEGLGVILSFTEEGLDIKMSISNPLEEDYDSRFGSKTSRRSSDSNLVLWIGIIAALIAMSFLVFVLMRKKGNQNIGNPSAESRPVNTPPPNQSLAQNQQTNNRNPNNNQVQEPVDYTNSN